MSDRLTISTIGTFSVSAPDGTDLTPRGRKACGLLALLALSPSGRRSRTSLQDKLWSDRGAPQGAASLRQALSEVRRALGPHRTVLQTDMRTAELAKSKVLIDIEHETLWPSRSTAEVPTLLDGITVRDAEFENWLRDQQSAFEARWAAARSPPVNQSRPSLRLVATDPAPPRESQKPWVRLRFGDGERQAGGRFVAQVAADRITQILREGDRVAVGHCERDGIGIDVLVDAMRFDDDVCLRVSVSAPGEDLKLWSDACTTSAREPSPSDSLTITALLQRAVAAIQRELRHLRHESGDPYALAYDAIGHLFSLEPGAVERADALLREASDLDPNPAFAAWRGYARTFVLGEAQPAEWAHVAEEAAELTREAMLLDPQNATIAALASYVQSFAMRNYEAGCELAEESLARSPNNPLGLAFLGRAQSYLGRADQGHQLASRALRVVGATPYRYTLYFLSGITALSSGRFEEAARLAEICRVLAPAYRAPQRYLVPLYLDLDNHPKAREAMLRMQALEPNFSLASLREAQSPNSGLAQAGLLKYRDCDLR